jgi:hypothetical protein
MTNVHWMTERRKPLARPGIPIYRGTCHRTTETLNGWQTKYYWFVTEDPDATPAEIMALGIYGPYDTEAAALEAARF